MTALNGGDQLEVDYPSSTPDGGGASMISLGKGGWVTV